MQATHCIPVFLSLLLFLNSLYLEVGDSKFLRTVRSQRGFMSQKLRFVHHSKFYVSLVQIRQLRCHLAPTRIWRYSCVAGPPTAVSGTGETFFRPPQTRANQLPIFTLNRKEWRCVTEWLRFGLKGSMCTSTNYTTGKEHVQYIRSPGLFQDRRATILCTGFPPLAVTTALQPEWACTLPLQRIGVPKLQRRHYDSRTSWITLVHDRVARLAFWSQIPEICFFFLICFASQNSFGFFLPFLHAKIICTKITYHPFSKSFSFRKNVFWSVTFGSISAAKSLGKKAPAANR